MNLLIGMAVLCAIAGCWTLIDKIRGHAREKAESEGKVVAKVIGETNLDKFFVECVLSGCNNFTTEKNIARAKLLADKYKLLYTKGIEELYDRAKKGHESVSQNIVDNQLSTKRAFERKEYARLNKYAEQCGKAKKIAMLTDKRNELLKNAEQLDKGARLMLKSTQQREKDWAVWGGVASGLAGAGAGLATALDIQAQNAEIRAQNEANMRAAMPAYMTVTGSASKNRENASVIQKEIDSIQEKLISDMPADEVLQQLEVINTTIDVSETGAFRITATIKAKEKLMIYGDVNAVADGTLIAHVYDGTDEIGTAKMVFPVDGLYEKIGLEGMGLAGAQIGKKYNVEFTAHNLWLMEK